MNGEIGQLQRAVYDDLTLERLYKDFGGKVSLQECARLLLEMQREEVWRCDEYQVSVDKTPVHGFTGMTVWHLSIKRIVGERGPIHDWRDLQEIKNQLCGPECEAMELYPAESRKVDSADQFHLYAFIKDNRRKRFPRLPVGWLKRFVVSDKIATGSQRELKPDEKITNPLNEENNT